MVVARDRSRGRLIAPAAFRSLDALRGRTKGYCDALSARAARRIETVFFFANTIVAKIEFELENKAFPVVEEGVDR